MRVGHCERSRLLRFPLPSMIMMDVGVQGMFARDSGRFIVASVWYTGMDKVHTNTPPFEGRVECLFRGRMKWKDASILPTAYRTHTTNCHPCLSPILVQIPHPTPIQLRTHRLDLQMLINLQVVQRLEPQ